MRNIPHHFPAGSPESPEQLAAMQSLTQSCGAGTAATVIASAAEIIKAIIFIVLRIRGCLIRSLGILGFCAENNVNEEEMVGANARFFILLSSRPGIKSPAASNPLSFS